MLVGNGRCDEGGKSNAADLFVTTPGKKSPPWQGLGEMKSKGEKPRMTRFSGLSPVACRENMH